MPVRPPNLISLLRLPCVLHRGSPCVTRSMHHSGIQRAREHLDFIRAEAFVGHVIPNMANSVYGKPTEDDLWFFGDKTLAGR